jgi:5-methylcytosine-specific restriction endonuclease McrA
VLELCGLEANVYQLAAAKSGHKYQHVGNEELLKDIKRVGTILGKDSFSSNEYNTYGEYSSSTCFKRFSSWNNTLIAAGLKPYIQVNGTRINDIEMLKEIERIWIKLGRQPTTSDIKNGISKYSLHAYTEHFGGWRGALKAFVNYINNDISNETDLVQAEERIESTNKDKPTRHTNSSKVKPQHKTSRDINLRLRFKIMQRDNFKCCICGASPAKDPTVELHIDHIVPWAKGGESTMDNLQTLCNKCNLGKSDLM